ncbi:MAG: hypothetical protein VCA36_10485 [Opitutales bacterium]|mgnify:CR=1 FL=1|jgi:hypothetical protein
MNPLKWKSVVVPVATYFRLKDLAGREHRTISGQFTHLLEEALKEPEKEEAA